MTDNATARRRGEQEPSNWEAERAAQFSVDWNAMIDGLFDPARFADTLDGLPHDLGEWAVFLATDEWVTPPNVIISGPPGAGKTWMALTAIRVAYSHGWAHAAVYVHPALWREVSRPPVNEMTVSSWATCPVLILDDIGALRLSDWDLEQLYLVLDERWRRALPTILISNEKGLRAMLGERIASRLAQSAIKVDLEPEDEADPDASDWRRR